MPVSRRPQSHTGLELLSSPHASRRQLLMSVFFELWSGYDQNRKDFEELYGCKLSVNGACGVHSGYLLLASRLMSFYSIWAQFLILPMWNLRPK